MPPSSFFRRGACLAAPTLLYLRLAVCATGYFLIFVGVVCQIVGLVSVNKDCHDDPEQSCNDFLRYDWWTTDYTLAVTLCLFLLQAYGIHRYMSSTVVVFVAVDIVQLINSAEKYLRLRNRGGDYRTASGGYILSTTGFMILSLALGGELRIESSTDAPTPTLPQSEVEMQSERAMDGRSPGATNDEESGRDRSEDGRGNTIGERNHALVPETLSTSRSPFRLDSSESFA